MSNASRRWLLPAALLTLAAAGTAWACYGRVASRAPLGFGRPPARGMVRRWDLTVLPSGKGLPPGRGTANQGRAIYLNQCASCHGQGGQGTEIAPALVGGRGSLATANPVLTPGSYWPYAPTLFGYIRRAMPYQHSGSLTPDEIYALTAWILYRNHVIQRGQVLNAHSLPEVQMPNRHGFVPDPRPELP